jgi:hypothetical protein
MCKKRRNPRHPVLAHDHNAIKTPVTIYAFSLVHTICAYRPQYTRNNGLRCSKHHAIYTTIPNVQAHGELNAHGTRTIVQTFRLANAKDATLRNYISAEHRACPGREQVRPRAFSSSTILCPKLHNPVFARHTISSIPSAPPPLSHYGDGAACRAQAHCTVTPVSQNGSITSPSHQLHVP